jgi:hypothetical protein
VDFDKRAKLGEMQMHGERKPLGDHGVNQHSGGVDNVKSSKPEGGDSAAYLAARLKRDHPDIATSKPNRLCRTRPLAGGDLSQTALLLTTSALQTHALGTR